MDKKIVPIGGGGGVNMADIFNAIYPLGSLYWSKNSTEPSTLFGGTWERVKDKFILAAGDNHEVGDEGGEESHALTVEETPAHAHTRGTMNITAQIGGYGDRTGFSGLDGAFYSKQDQTRIPVVGDIVEGHHTSLTVGFDASRSWTGETSSVGGGEAHNNMPPYATYYCWERIK